MSFSDAKRTFLVDHLGEAEVTRLESDTGALKTALEKKGVEWKDVPDADDEGTKVLTIGDLGADAVKALAEEAGKAAATALVETPAFKDMVVAQATIATDVKGLLERVVELEKSDDEKIAAAVGARSARPAGHVASASKGNTLTDEEKEAAAKDQGGPTILDEIMDGLEVGASAT